MKTITLSGEQREQLLEMAKALFPEYNFGFQNDYEDVGIMEYYPPANGLGGWKFIHWFEFCMTHLSSKVFNALHDFTCHMTADYAEECAEEWQNNLMRHMSFHYLNPTRVVDVYDSGKVVAWHPVDYLYTQFKQLK